MMKKYMLPHKIKCLLKVEKPCLNISKPIESNMTQKSIQSIENLVSDDNAIA